MKQMTQMFGVEIYHRYFPMSLMAQMTGLEFLSQMFADEADDTDVWRRDLLQMFPMPLITDGRFRIFYNLLT